MTNAQYREDTKANLDAIRDEGALHFLWHVSSVLRGEDDGSLSKPMKTLRVLLALLGEYYEL